MSNTKSGVTSFVSDIPSLAFYDMSLLSKPLKDLTGPEAAKQFQFLTDRYVYAKDPKKGVSVSLSDELIKRRDDLGQMLSDDYTLVKYLSLQGVEQKDSVFPQLNLPSELSGQALSGTNDLKDLSSGNRFGLGGK